MFVKQNKLLFLLTWYCTSTSFYSLFFFFYPIRVHKILVLFFTSLPSIFLFSPEINIFQVNVLLSLSCLVLNQQFNKKIKAIQTSYFPICIKIMMWLDCSHFTLIDHTYIYVCIHTYIAWQRQNLYGHFIFS